MVCWLSFGFILVGLLLTLCLVVCGFVVGCWGWLVIVFAVNSVG